MIKPAISSPAEDGTHETEPGTLRLPSGIWAGGAGESGGSVLNRTS